MKKLTALLLALVMVFALAACGSKNETAPADEGSAAAETAEAASDLKVGFIFLHDENSTYDKNFMDAAKAACEKLGVASAVLLAPEPPQAARARHITTARRSAMVFFMFFPPIK